MLDSPANGALCDLTVISERLVKGRAAMVPEKGRPGHKAGHTDHPAPGNRAHPFAANFLGNRSEAFSLTPKFKRDASNLPHDPA